MNFWFTIRNTQDRSFAERSQIDKLARLMSQSRVSMKSVSQELKSSSNE
jgi:hypothetical protein